METDKICLQKGCLTYTDNLETLMPNQKDIAKALQVTQATVSRALRGDRTISAEMRQKVRRAAKRIGYHPNAYLTVLMSNVRKGKDSSKKGVIGLLIEARSQEEWYQNDSYRVFHRGVLQRALELGFRVESFFLKKPGLGAPQIDRILYTRGITGIILAPPYHGNRTLDMHWEKYAAIGVGFGWEQQELNRVVYDSLYNFTTAFNELRQMGYKRIGTILGDTFIKGSRHGVKWYTAFLDCQNSIPVNEQIPVLASKNPPPEKGFSEEDDRVLGNEFREWFLKWKPEAVLTMVGRERKWLGAMDLKIPRDVGLACLAQSADLHCARIDDKSEVVGATALELVAAQIARNEFGPPVHPKATMIEGRWVCGTTVQNRTRK